MKIRTALMVGTAGLWLWRTLRRGNGREVQPSARSLGGFGTAPSQGGSPAGAGTPGAEEAQRERPLKQGPLNRGDVEELLAEVNGGDERYLENMETHHAGRLVGLEEDEVEVDIYGKRERWPVEKSKEFRPDANYRE